MSVEVTNVQQNKRMQIKADMEFNTVSLVQLWEKCEDAKAYMERLSNRVSSSRYSQKWERLINRSLENVIALSQETSTLLSSMGAFDAIRRSRRTEELHMSASYHSKERAPQRTQAKSTR